MTPPLEDLARLYFLETPAQLRDYLWEKSCLRIKLGIDDGRTEPPPGLWGRGCHESHRAWPWLGWGSGSPALPPAGPPSRGRTAPKAGAARTPAPGESRGSAPLTALTRSIKASSEDTARRAAYRGAPAHSGCLTPPLRAAPRRTAARSPRPPDRSLARSIAHSLSNAERGSAAAAQTPAAHWLAGWLAGWLPRLPQPLSAGGDQRSAADRHDRTRSPPQFKAAAAPAAVCARPSNGAPERADWSRRDATRHPDLATLATRAQRQVPCPRDWMARKHSNSIGSGSAGTGRGRPVIGPGGRCLQLGGATGREGAPGSVPASGGWSTSPRQRQHAGRAPLYGPARREGEACEEGAAGGAAGVGDGGGGVTAASVLLSKITFPIPQRTWVLIKKRNVSRW